MSKIVLLNEEISNLIAAGEVVENMASVVKELVENAIDANSTSVQVDLLEEGLKSIEVTDNGEGMRKDDLFLSIKRHATSKIKTQHDLFHIQSLGFRGEALPSIASVSELEMISGNGETAHKMQVKNGQVINLETHAPIQGTRITVKNLFYNTPARLKHLKATLTELSYIVDYINKMALSHPEIRFVLTNNHKALFQSTGDGDILKVLSEIYPLEVIKNMRYFENENSYFKISGYLTKPFIHRSTRKHMSVIANDRMIKNNSLLKAITQGYNTYLPIGKYPIVALFIEMDPLLIDVNVHPQKLEVKLTEERTLRQLIIQTLQSKLRSLDLIPDVKKKARKDDSAQETLDLRETKPVQEGPKTVTSYKDFKQDKAPVTHIEETPQTEYAKTQDALEHLDSSKVPDSLEIKTPLSRLEYIGQYLGTYLVCQNETGLYLIDQHAAAERIRYERYYANMGSAKIEQKPLLLPIELEVSNDEIIALEESLPIIHKLGLTLDIKDNKLFMTHVPTWFLEGFEETYAEEIIKQILNEEDVSIAMIRDPLAKELSCKHSIKANHYINEGEIEQLLRDLEHCNNPYTCPHGRPVTIRFTQQEIEKLFKRIQS
ncbi:MAG: DNA mismatch repair endonuclease MutL [Candidatus Izemoplasma sp.]|nr:DNA mismatch repair endonuclease MutL [Candidatus Izemoplasma sp.]